MAKSRCAAGRAVLAVGVLLAGLLSGVGLGTAGAQTSTVTGSAYGYFSRISLFDGPPADRGPTPTVALPAGGSAMPVTASVPSGDARYGPGIFFTSDQIEVSTQGTPGGTVTSSTKITNLNKSGAETLTASGATSMCSASSSGVSGSATITGGQLQTDDGDGSHPAVVMPVPANPAPNTSFDGTLRSVGDTFRYILNEQIKNPDGSITVNAAHQIAIGPTAKGDLIIGQVVCGVTGPAATSTTMAGPTTTTAAAPTTTTVAGTPRTTTGGSSGAGGTGATTTTAPATTAPATTTTAAPTGGATTGVGGGAYGYFSRISLFGGASADRGPAPTVALPASGSASPVTASAPSGDARYGPGIFFTSGPIDVSTQGTPGGTVTSSTKITNLNTSGAEVLTASGATSTCSASSSGVNGSATITGGKLQTDDGNPNVDGDETYVAVPANPAPNTSFDGKLQSVGDTYKYIFNEQIRNADGSITVNAAHQVAIGPTAKGDLIIGQSRCSTTGPASSSTGGGAAGGTGGSSISSGGGGGGLVNTGMEAARMVALALGLLAIGWSATRVAPGVQVRWRRRRSMPWSRRSLLG